jgi:hypothetical protein
MRAVRRRTVAIVGALALLALAAAVRAHVRRAPATTAHVPAPRVARTAARPTETGTPGRAARPRATVRVRALAPAPATPAAEASAPGPGSEPRRAFRLTGTLVDESGEPWPRAEVTVCDESYHAIGRAATAGDGGAFAVEDARLSSDLCCLKIVYSYEGGEQTVWSDPFPIPADEVELGRIILPLAAPTARLIVHVVSPAGAPARADVRVRDTEERSWEGMLARAGDDGVATFLAWPGRWFVAASDDVLGLITRAPTAVEVAAHEVAEVTVALEPGGVVEGRVRAPRGLLASREEEVHVLRTDADPFPVGSALVDVESGSFRIVGLPAGHFVLAVEGADERHGSREARAEVDLALGETRSIDLSLEGETHRLTLTMAPRPMPWQPDVTRMGMSEPLVSWRTASGDGQRHATDFLTPAGASETTCVFEWLPAGRVTVEAEIDRYHFRTPVDVPEVGDAQALLTPPDPAACGAIEAPALGGGVGQVTMVAASEALSVFVVVPGGAPMRVEGVTAGRYHVFAAMSHTGRASPDAGEEADVRAGETTYVDAIPLLFGD